MSPIVGWRVAVDYFYGGGNAYVEKTTFYNLRSGAVIVAPSHGAGTRWGYIFDHCTVDGKLRLLMVSKS